MSIQVAVIPHELHHTFTTNIMSLPTSQKSQVDLTFLLWQCRVWVQRQSISSPRRANHSQNVEQCQGQHVERITGDFSLQCSCPSRHLQFYIIRGHLSWRDQYCSCHPIPVLMVLTWCPLVIDTIKSVLSIQTEPISACTETLTNVYSSLPISDCSDASDFLCLIPDIAWRILHISYYCQSVICSDVSLVTIYIRCLT